MSFGVAATLGPQLCAAMRTGIEIADKIAVPVSGNDNWLSSHMGCEEVMGIRDLCLVAQENPVAFENMLHFEIEQFFVEKCRSVNAKEAALVVLMKHAPDPIC